MPLFAVIAANPNADLAARIDALFPTATQKINDRTWLVDAETTASVLSDQLEIRGGARGLVLVIQVVPGGASGWQVKSLWDWLGLKAAKSP
jgi:hypothetical protein